MGDGSTREHGAGRRPLDGNRGPGSGLGSAFSEHGVGDVDDLLLERVTSAAMRIMERVERLTALEPSESELNLRQVRLLKALFRRGEMPVGQLSRVIRAPLSTTSEVVGSLVRLGYVEKVRDPEDHRVVRVKLTGKGFEEVGRRLQHQQEAFRRILGDMAPGSRLRFAEALDVLEAVLEEAVLRPKDPG